MQPEDLFQQPGQPPAVPPERYQRFLALDYGKKRTGIAVGNRILGTASPCKSITAQGDERFAAVAAVLQEWQPEALVLGIPWHPDGAAHQNTKKAIAFGDLSYYWVIERQPLTIKRLSELYSVQGQIGFTAYERLDGKLILPEAVKVLQMAQ